MLCSAGWGQPSDIASIVGAYYNGTTNGSVGSICSTYYGTGCISPLQCWGTSTLQLLNASATRLKAVVRLCTVFQTKAGTAGSIATQLQSLLNWGGSSGNQTGMSYVHIDAGLVPVTTNSYLEPTTQLSQHYMGFNKINPGGVKCVKLFRTTFGPGQMKRFIHKVPSMKFTATDYGCTGSPGGGALAFMTDALANNRGMWAGKTFFWVVELESEYAQVAGVVGGINTPTQAPAGQDVMMKELTKVHFRPITFGQGNTMFGTWTNSTIASTAPGVPPNTALGNFHGVAPGQSAAGTLDTTTNFGGFAGQASGKFYPQSVGPATTFEQVDY